MAFGGELDYTKKEKYPKDAKGGKFFNQRTMNNKALKAYLKGESFFMYKGTKYAVPIIPDGQQQT